MWVFKAVTRQSWFNILCQNKKVWVFKGALSGLRQILVDIFTALLKAIAMHILPNISRSKGNQTKKFGQLMEYNIFLDKLYI